MPVRYRIFPLRLPFALTMAVLLLCPAAASAAQQKPKGVNVVMIDPGHGGADPGTVYGNFMEKEINLSVAQALGELIRKNHPEVKVLYTRTGDVAVGLRERGDMANKAGADLFISIHVNAVAKGRPAPSGALTLLMGPNDGDKNLDIAMRENDVITYEQDYSEKYEGYIPGSAESFIIFSLMQYAHVEQSMSFARILQSHYKKSTPMPDLGARQQGILVLWRTTMPAVLTELGFLSNSDDRKVLTSKTGQKRVATAIFNAFSEYKAKVEGHSKPILIAADDDPAETTPAAANATPSASANPTPSTAPSQAAQRQSPSQANGEVVYRVQICSSAKKLGQNHQLLRPFKEELTERTVGNLYKYCVGSCTTYREAQELQVRVRKSVPDAFMVAFRGEEQIPVSEARKLTK